MQMEKFTGTGSIARSFIIGWMVLMLATGVLRAQDIPEAPDPPKLVNDFAGILDKAQAEALEGKLVAFNDTTSNQIVVVTVKSLNGYPPAMFATELGQKWKVGQGKFNNGVVLLIKPKYGNERGQAYIAVGYGLEPVIPDAIAKRVVEKEMIPYFARGNYYKGIEEATNVLMALAVGEFNDKTYTKGDEKGAPIGSLIFFLLVIGIIIWSKIARARAYSVGHGTSFWQAFMLASLMGGGSDRGHWDDFTGGSSGGGFGGGGFGGFGGGGFGGGGAGGSW
jgi:uncharacterized protein